MPSNSRDNSRDRELTLKHQHSWSDSGRSSVPMWDSSDPDRAPPPLPLNPGLLNISPTKPNTSSHVAAAAQALVDKARESLTPSPYTINRSPEKSPTRTPQHRRLQSLQTGSTKDIRSHFENGPPSPDRAGSRSVTPASTRDLFSSSPERSLTPTPVSTSKDLVRSGRAVRRASSRPELRPILSENTPPSSTILAMQNMTIRDTDGALSNITNQSSPRTPQPYDGIYSQIANLTSIATKLQSEMVALSRRSKDNATDLISLKNATNTRDEDIRKALKELIGTLRASDAGLLGPPPAIPLRSSTSFDMSHQLLDRPHSPATITKTVSLPRIISYNTDPTGRSDGLPPASAETAATVAMLEKIIRQMATKDGQDKLLNALPELLSNSGKESLETKTKLDELLRLVREKDSYQAALVKHRDVRQSGANESSFMTGASEDGSAMALTRANRDLGFGSPTPTKKAVGAEIVNEDMMRLLQKIKDSVAHSGGITGEVKSLVRDLRGEVLGMGRELGRKVDKQLSGVPDNALAKRSAPQEDLSRIMKDGLAELREQMNRVIQSKRRQSSGSNASRNSVDSQEVFAVVKQALAERGLDRTQPARGAPHAIDRDAIFAAVKEAYEEYKPEIEVQQFGLDRDEILVCLREGLEEYRSKRETKDPVSLSKDEIVGAMQQALKDFQPPQPITDASEVKAEVLAAVRECLDEHRSLSQNAPTWTAGEVSREDIVGAVRETLSEHKRDGAREIDINRNDLFEAVQAGLENSNTPFGGYGDKVLHSLKEIVQGMSIEFQEYSKASGKDTEQVLDALKDSHETLRGHIETYADRSQNTGKDEILQQLQTGLSGLQRSFEDMHARSHENGSDHTVLTDNMKAEFQQLHEAITAQASNSQQKDAVLMAIHAGFMGLRASLGIRNADGDPADETLDAMKEEFVQLRSRLDDQSAAYKAEIVESLQDSIKHSSTRTKDEMVSLLQQELGAFKENIETTMTRADSALDKDHVIEAVKEAVDEIRAQLAAEQSELASEHFGAIRDDIEQLREILDAGAGGVSASHKDEILETLRTGLDGLQPTGERGLGNELTTPSLFESVRDEIQGLRQSFLDKHGERDLNNGHAEALDLIRGELEHLRQSLASTLVKNGASMDTDEIIDTVRLGLDDLRSHIEKKLDNPDRQNAASNEMLDALNEGLEGLRLDFSKMYDKSPAVDMTVSYEILDTLKDGLNGVREDIARLKSSHTDLKNGEVVLADSPKAKSAVAAEDVTSSALKKNDLDKLEVMLAHLQIKVEAMDQNIQSNPSASSEAAAPESVRKEDLDSIVVMLTDIQGAVADISTRTSDRNADMATKEDTDAIETLLQNTKAKIDDHILPSLESAVTKDDLDSVEAVIRLNNDAVDELATKVASKEDLSALELLMQDATSSLDDLRSKLVESDSAEKVTKSDVDAVEMICTDIKDRLRELPKSTEVPTKADVEELTGLLVELRHKHSKFTDRYENDITVTARAFDDRREDTKVITEHMAELKLMVEATKDELKHRLKRGTEDVRALDEILQCIEEKIEDLPNAITDVADLKELVKEGHDRVDETVSSLRADHEQQSLTILGKQDELRMAIIGDLADKLDDRLGTLLTRHDEHQQATEQLASDMTQRARQQDDVLAASRTVTEDLKSVIDTLGASIVTIAPTLTEATDRMSDDAKTVFNRMVELSSKLEDNHIDNKADHEMTRREMDQFQSSVNTLREEVTGFHPQFMQTLKEVLVVVGEHYEHSKHFQESSKAQTEDIKSSFSTYATTRDLDAPMLPPPPSAFDDSRLHQRLDDLSQLADHTALHRKLDDILDQRQISSPVGSMDELREQLASIASEVSAFVTFQTKMMNAGHENKEREANQAAIDLSRCLHEKERLESSVSQLTEERTDLSAEVEALRAERDALMAHKAKMSTDVSSLEMALKIRREELHHMDARADALERRIIEGVMDHSRALLLARTSKPASTFNLKRVGSNVSSSTAHTTLPASTNSSAVSTGIGMALKSRSPAPRSQTPTNPKARRIMSLGQISANRGAATPPLSTTPSSVLSNMKRSHTVKGVHKSPYHARRTVSDFDKENEVDENDENHQDTTEQSREMVPYDGGAGSVFEGMTGSEYTYGTGSYITGTASSRRSSFGTIRSTIDTTMGELPETEEEAEDDTPSPAQTDAADERAEQQVLQVYTGPLEQEKHDMYESDRDRHHESDSGLGTDLPTAPLSHTYGSDLFQVAEERL